MDSSLKLIFVKAIRAIYLIKSF